MLNAFDLARVDLNLLVVFEAVFEERHVRRAAARLHVTPSAVSHGLGRLRQLFDDPLFLRKPKGVVPTARAGELAPPIADILARVRGVVGTVDPFDPATSTRRFTIGAPDATLALLLPGLLSSLSRQAPHIDVSFRHLLPDTGLAELEARSADLVIVALDAVPARFFATVIHEDEFVIAARSGHPFLKAPTLRRYCELQHVLVSIVGDSRGYVDEVLAEKGLTRRVALTVPHFMLALAALSNSDLVAAIPATLLAVHARRFGLASVKAPLPLRRWQLRAIAPKVALEDAGIAWLFEAVRASASGSARPKGESATERQRRGGAEVPQQAVTGTGARRASPLTKSATSRKLKTL